MMFSFSHTKNHNFPPQNDGIEEGWELVLVLLVLSIDDQKLGKS